MSTAKIVIDLGFGDGGKGLVVDNLCSKKEAHLPLVVRFSGGQQCGHTVMTPEGKKHVFSSFGSGSLVGCPTFFTEDTTVYLPSIITEYHELSKLIKPKLILHPLAMLTTPYDVAYNRAKEEVLTKHGSCGLGVGATMKRCIETPYKTFAQDLLYPDLLMHKLESVHRYYLRLLDSNIDPLRATYLHYVNLLTPVFLVDLENAFPKAIQEDWLEITAHSDIISCNRSVIFEGSQGVMLDMDHGVFPNVTYANTTCKNALKYCNKWRLQPELFYVTRCYTTRHGRGWMPNETPIDLINTDEEINVQNKWQEDFRIGEFSYDMIKNSIQIDCAYHPNEHLIRKNLVVTCYDQRPGFELCTEEFKSINSFFKNDSPHRGSLRLL